MNKHLHNSDELFDSPQYGWEQMQSLLEKKLPQNTRNKKKPLLTFFIAASWILVFLFSSLVIKNIAPSTSGSKNKKIHLADQFSVDNKNHSAVVAAGKIIPATGKAPASAAGFKNYSGYVPVNISQSNHTNRSHQINAEALYHTATMLPRLTAERPVSNPGIIQPADRSWEEINSAAIPVPEKKAKAGKNSAHGSWNISAGLAMNAMMGEKQSLRPYPAAEIRYNISDRFYVSAGLAPGSPLAVSSRGIDKRVYLNDTSNNVNFYNNVKHYSRLTYADVPLMAGVKISKKINIQAGVQASVLMHTKTTSAIEQYDFQMVMSNGLPANLITAAPPVSEEKYKVSARKIDYRFVAGVQYDIGKASLNLNYQHASRTALKGNQVSSKRNELISLGIQFNIR